MFGKLAAEALGISDIGKVIKKEDFNKVDSDDYIFHEINEKIFFLIKSKKDEYCFTNFALIHLDGDSAMSKKRLLKRYEYSENDITNVKLETAGTVDLDVELKFTIGDQDFSIDCHKDHIESIKDIYKTLVYMSQMMKKERIELSVIEQSLNLTASSLARTNSNEDVLKQATALYGFYQQTLDTATKEANKKDYSEAFDLFLSK